MALLKNKIKPSIKSPTVSSIRTPNEKKEKLAGLNNKLIND